MSKRNIAYIKPDEPSFLRRIKEQVGYKEGPTVDTKREDREAASEEDFLDGNEEKPVVVVLKPGDLTAEEAETHARHLEKEEEEKKADLDAPIVFKAPTKKKSETEAEDQSLVKKRKVSKKEKAKTKSLLSFDDEVEEEN